MEVAGIVLGGIPVVLYALDNYHRCLQPAKDYWKYDSTLKTIRMNIFIQQEQLQLSLRNIGLERPTQQELQEHLLQLYPLAKCKEFLNIIVRMEEAVQRLTDNLDVDSQGKVRLLHVVQYINCDTNQLYSQGGRLTMRGLIGNGGRYVAVLARRRGKS
jgi:hypothetical protein